MKRGATLRLILAATMAVLIVAFYILAHAGHWLSPESLREHRDTLMRFVSSHYGEALLICASACLLLVAVSLPISGFFMVLCGMVFGRWTGTLLVAVCATLGATLAMLMVRYLGQDFVRGRIRRHRRAQKLLRGLDRHRGSYLLFLRLVPGFPFWLTNILLGLTDITAWRYLCLTLIGILPDSFIYSNIGANLATMKTTRDIMSPASIIALALLAISCLSPVLIHELERRKILPPGWPLDRA
jgi:uncharacterized membrane protein YdjX (TVP38/TMEM64 family)